MENVLVRGDSELFRSTLSDAVTNIRMMVYDSEGYRRNGSLKPSLVQALSEVKQQLANICTVVFSPEQFDGIVRVSTYENVMAEIELLTSMLLRLDDYLRGEWFLPVITLMYLCPVEKVDISKWLNTLLTHQETSDLAAQAIKALEVYKLAAGVDARRYSAKDRKLVVPEPALRQGSSARLLSIMPQQSDLREIFRNHVNNVIDFLNRVDPGEAIESGDSVLIQPSCRVEDPIGKFIRSETVGMPWAAGTFEPLGKYGLKVTGGGVQTQTMVFSVSNKSNMPLSNGLNYYIALDTSFHCTVQLTAGSLTVNTGDPAVNTILTFPTNVVDGTAIQDSSLLPVVLVEDALNGGFKISLTLTWSINSTGTFWCDPTISLLSCTPNDREILVGDIYSRTAAGYARASSTWSNYYGTQIMDDSYVDPDFSLVGYFNNYLADLSSIKVVMEVLQLLLAYGLTARVVAEGDTTFDEKYQGATGLSQLVADLANNPANLLSTTGIFYDAVLPKNQKRKKDQQAVFSKLRAIIANVLQAFIYEDPDTVTVVKKILTPYS